ncbi:hypothetical protein LF1_02060 [Rubripirellula obstinata]|uniref:Uncharacterized protein n=1 Tax=Rubripirellula obstinata TaxID=406547 RepID=A0A5B1C9B5_9BACT|nr:hypothetical protein LF1_02060 [Rubripirellula obstinata]
MHGPGGHATYRCVCYCLSIVSVLEGYVKKVAWAPGPCSNLLMINCLRSHDTRPGGPCYFGQIVYESLRLES